MKKGFTLIELLAVIVILAIIAAITVPTIVGIIDNARKASYKESVRSIFEAANIYIASQNFTTFPDEGINVTDSVLKIKNKTFTSGKILLNENGKLEVDKVSNGRYCAGGLLEDVVVIEGSCDQLDVTPPTITLTSNLITSSSITIVAVGEDLESGINGYEFSKDNGTTWTNKQTGNVYTFNNLTNNTNYNFKVRAINNNQLSTLSDNLVVKTSDIPIPTYSIDTTAWVLSAIVTIHYPVRETGYVYQYSLDNALTWNTVDAPATTKDITFIDNGSVIARILDGTNEISGTSYTVANIDKTNPSIGITVVGSHFNANGWAKANFNLNVQGTDSGSGVKSYAYCQTTSATCTPTTVVNAVSGTVTISTESTTNKVCAFSTDNANNNSGVACSDPYKLDKTPPVITVNPITISLDQGSTYNDTGISATDNLNGDISASVIRTGSVNTATLGSYTLTYNVSDAAGNAATTKNRTVSIIGAAVSSISVGQLNNRSMVLYNNQYYIYWPSGTSIGYMVLNSQMQVASSGSFPMNGSTYDCSALSLSTNTGSLIWTASRNNHYFGSHLNAGTSFGWHNAGYMDVALLNGYTILFHTGRSDANYARVYNYNTGQELDTYYSDGGWGESWRVFPYSSDTALAIGNASGRIKVTVATNGNMTYQNNPAEMPSDLPAGYNGFGRIQMDENKKFNYMTSGNIYKNQLGSVTLNVDVGTITDYALNIHPNLAVTATLINGNLLNYRIINRKTNQIVTSKTYTLDTTYSYLTPIQSVGNANESVFVIQNSSRNITKIFKIGLPT